MAIAGYLKQSTAATIVLGPFVDKTDGVTAETGRAASLVARLSKNGAAFGARSDATAIAHLTGTGNEGYYSCVLNATDTNTTGRLAIVVNDSAESLPVRQDYVVLRSDEFDALFDSNGAANRGILAAGTAQAATSTTLQLASAETFADSTLIGATVLARGSTQGYWQSRTITAYTGSTDTATVDAWTVTPSGTITYIVLAGAPASASSPLPANVTQIAGQTASASGTVTFPNATIASTTNITAGTITTATNVTTVNGLASGVITATSIAADAITSAKLATSVTTAIRDAILNWEPYTGYNLARLLRAMGIVLRGTASGLNTTSATYTAPAGSATVTATVDADGNRSVVSDTASGTP